MTEPDDLEKTFDTEQEDDSFLAETNNFLPTSTTDSLGVSSFTMMGSVDDDSDEFVIPNESFDLEAGDHLGKYEIKKKLGQGGMGAVYLAFDPMIEREVAIKVLPPQSSSKSIAFERFLSEARATGKLNHPNVVSIYDINKENETSYIVMELVRGGSGTDYIAERKEIDWRDSIRIAANAADGLAAAHRIDLIHRDIKPENLMLTEDGVAKVVDFGLSKLTDSAAEQNLNLTTEGQVLGTPMYMSPEQFQNESVDARSDVYCLGGTLFTLITGSVPFPQAKNLVTVMKAHVSDAPPDPTELNNELPGELKQIVAKAMAKDPKDRYQNAGELASVLWEVHQNHQRSERLSVPEEYRACSTAVIIEPSKMQAMMLARQLNQAGVEDVAVFETGSDAAAHFKSAKADLIVSAMQLSDCTGATLLNDLHLNDDLRHTTFVLNTSDVDLYVLFSTRLSISVAVVSKKTKPSMLLSSLSASTFVDFSIPDPDLNALSTGFRLGIVSDTPRVPEAIVELVRESNLLDVNITTFDELAAGTKPIGSRDLVMALRHAGETVDDHRVFAELLERMHVDCSNLVAVQVTGSEINLRSYRLAEYLASTKLPLEFKRWMRILAACAS